MCNLCNRFVQCVIRSDRKDVFRFGSLQSEKAQQILKRFESKPLNLTTVVLLDDETIVTESDAVLKIAKKLSGIWNLVYLFIVVPKFIRDTVYRFVSRYRYHIFGRRDACMIPTPELLDKFI